MLLIPNVNVSEKIGQVAIKEEKIFSYFATLLLPFKP